MGGIDRSMCEALVKATVISVLMFRSQMCTFFYIYWTKLTDASQTLQISMLQPLDVEISCIPKGPSILICRVWLVLYVFLILLNLASWRKSGLTNQYAPTLRQVWLTSNNPCHRCLFWWSWSTSTNSIILTHSLKFAEKCIRTVTSNVLAMERR